MLAREKSNSKGNELISSDLNIRTLNLALYLKLLDEKQHGCLLPVISALSFNDLMDIINTMNVKTREEKINKVIDSRK